MHTLSQRGPPFVTVEMDILTSALVLNEVHILFPCQPIWLKV